MNASEDYQIGLVLRMAKSNNGLLAHEAKMLANYVSDLHAGVDIAMDILNAEGDHADNAAELRALDDRISSIVAIVVRSYE